MPTPSEPTTDTLRSARNSEWAARSDKPRRSVFGNYRVEMDSAPASDTACFEERHQRAETAPSAPATLQSSIDIAIARSFLHRLLAQAYQDPTPEGWGWLTRADTLTGLRAAVAALPVNSLVRDGERLAQSLTPGGWESFLDAYLACFGHAARGSCPLNEIEYGDIKADPLFQPHRLADLAAFYRAFGLEVAGDAGERHDHLCLELEFMCVLAAKEAYALENQLDADQLAQCREAQKKFLREHLGRWTPAFARRLAAATSDPALRVLAEFTRVFVESECAHFGVNSGSEELSLRPVDDAADRMCESCGVANPPPGALAAP